MRRLFRRGQSEIGQGTRKPIFGTTAHWRLPRRKLRPSRILMALILGAALSTWQISAVTDQSQAPLRAPALTAAVAAAGDGQRNNQDNLPVGLPAALSTASR